MKEGSDLPTSVSVILPVFNRQSLVGRAISSVLEQDYPELELIVVDDGSTDDTPRMIASFDDPRLKLIRFPERRGGNAARNHGISMARGALLAFLDSDDYYLPNKLSTEVAILEARPDLDLIVSGFATEYPSGRKRIDTQRSNPNINSTEEFVEALFQRKIRKATPGIVVRREVALRAGGFDENLKRRQDYDFLLRVAQAGRCATIDKVLWVKSYPTDAVSRDHGSTVPTILNFCVKHTAYCENPAFRTGLALDVARHFSRILKRRMLRLAIRDAALLIRRFGAARFVSLLRQGFPHHKELLRERRLDVKVQVPRRSV